MSAEETQPEIGLGNRVSYTTKELLQEVRGDIKLVLAQLSSKADKAQVDVLGSRVDLVQERVLLLEADARGRHELHARHTRNYETLSKRVESDHASLRDFPLVRRLVFGFVTLILVAVVGALLALLTL